MAQARGSISTDQSTTTPNIEFASLAESIISKLRQACDCDKEGFCIHSFDLPAVDIVGRLRAMTLYPKAFWQDREQEIELAGMGQAFPVSAGNAELNERFLEASRLFRDHPNANSLAFFVAGRFDQTGRYAGHDWSAFPDFWWQLPNLTISRRGQSYVVTVVIGPEQDRDTIVTQVQQTLSGLSKDQSLGPAMSVITGRRDRPDRAEWNAGCRNVLSEIANGALQKVVLARRTEFALTEALDPLAYLKALGGNSQVYRYLLSPCPGTAFVGASPERLLKATGDHLESEAVAGTVPRGQSDETDEQLARLLQESRKDNREHQFVIDGIMEGLRPLSRSVTALSQPQIVKLRRVQHLLSPIKALLNAGVSVAQVLETLHPTPAVCGTPRNGAMLSLRQLEPFDRGYYSGPVGVLMGDRAEVAVALRSALIHKNSVNLYAGAGIVAGSDPDIEWLELEQKLQGSLELLSGGSS